MLGRLGMLGRRGRVLLGVGIAIVALSVTLVTALQASASRALAPLRQEACAALRVVARDGQLLRVVPPACGQRGVSWVSLAEVPAVLRDAVVVAEDQRFLWHPGVDGLALARAALQDVLARRRVSGASTITMQLMRMLHHAGEPRTLGNKLSEIWLALAAERGASKHEILEAYLNTAYYGHGAYGLASAAQLYFGKSVRALSDSEALLLAVLPRAPSAYDPLLHAPAALARRGVLLAALVRAGRLGQAQAHELAAQTPHVELHAVAGASEAPHFVDWVVDSLPAAERRAGGELVTTLDLALQRQLERVVREQVMRLSEHGVTQAGVVVLDTQTSEVRAMVGSVDYAASQLNLTLRRRHPGSLLKPFVYALAIEAGARPGSLIYDVGDVPSQFHARDWVEHEGGVLPMREALAGSYNLAAVHALENVGVGKLRERLRELGVAELEQAPDRYGLQLALGSARVRLLDATAGFGFMVRGGSVREARAVRELRRAGHAVYAPVDAGERRGFSPEVSWLVMQMLSEPDNRHGRFGRGLPVEGSDATGAGTRVVAKTGTASGMSDMTTVLATREFLVGAWSGRLDGAPARGTSGMWSAAPLARLALDTALQGNTPSLPERPSGVRSEALCAISGLAAQPACPHTLHSFALASMPETKPCDWHRAGDSELHAPAELQAWLTRARARGPRLDLH